MNKLWNNHMHCEFSGDSDAPMKDMIEESIICKMGGITFLFANFKQFSGIGTFRAPDNQHPIRFGCDLPRLLLSFMSSATNRIHNGYIIIIFFD